MECTNQAAEKIGVGLSSSLRDAAIHIACMHPHEILDLATNTCSSLIASHKPGFTSPQKLERLWSTIIVDFPRIVSQAHAGRKYRDSSIHPTFATTIVIRKKWSEFSQTARFMFCHSMKKPKKMFLYQLIREVIAHSLYENKSRNFAHHLYTERYLQTISNQLI